MTKEKHPVVEAFASQVYEGLKAFPDVWIDYDCLMEGGVEVHISWDTSDPYFRKLYQDYYGVPFDDEE